MEAVRSRPERSKSPTRMWRAGNPHLNERLSSPDRTEFSVSIGTEATFQSQLKPKKIAKEVSSPTLKPKSTAAPHSPWPRPFAPRAPQQPRPPCSLASALLRAGPTSPSGSSSATASGLPTTSRPRRTGTAMEISRFPSKRLLRMPGSTTTRGQHVSCAIDAGCVAFCWTENISAPDLSYAAQYLACALPCERFTSALAGSPCITRGRCGSLRLHRAITLESIVSRRSKGWS